MKKKDEEVQRKKEEVKATSSDPQPSRSNTATEAVGTASQQQGRAHNVIAKMIGKDQGKSQQTNETNNTIEYQSSGAAPSNKEWQTQNKKNFKSNSQNNKRQHQVYMPKQSAAQPNTASIQTNTAPPQSGMTHDPSTLAPGALAISNVPDAQQQVPNPHHPHVDPIANEVHGGNKVCQEKPLDRQEGDPKGAEIPYFLHECATTQSTDHRMDFIPPCYR